MSLTLLGGLLPGALLLGALLLACVALSAAIVRVMARIGTLDHPGARSSHVVPTPKGGGVGIVASVVVGMVVLSAVGGRALVPDGLALGLIGAACLIAVVSYYDDLRSWSFTVKLGAQGGAALLAVACGIRLRVLHLPMLGAVDTGWLGAPLSVLWIMAATNAVNFIDGLNGLAAGAVGIACLFLAGIAWGAGDGFVTSAALLLAAGIAGFLPFNYPRARIFMGDVGSQFCGFVIAVLGVLAAGFGARTLSVLVVPMLLFAVLFDVVFTLARRALAGDRVTQAHRGHLYQLAHRAGMPAWRVTLIYWAMGMWNGACCVGFAREGAWRLLAVVMPQFLWLGWVVWRARRGDVGTW